MRLTSSVPRGRLRLVGRGRLYGRIAAACAIGASALVLVAAADAVLRGGQITGFGATVAAWNAHHSEDHRGNLVPGCCYDPIPDIPGLRYADRYYAVQPIGKYVISYEMRPGDGKGIPISAARQAAMAELPADTRMRSFIPHGGSCAILIAYSPSLQKQLGHGKAGGGVVVEFSSGAAEDSYNPRAVNDLLFSSLIIAGSTAQNC